MEQCHNNSVTDSHTDDNNTLIFSNNVKFIERRAWIIGLKRVLQCVLSQRTATT